MEIFTTALGVVVGVASVLFVGWTFVDAFGFTAAEYREADSLPRMLWLVMLAFGFGLLLWLGGSAIVREPLGMRSLAWIAVMIAAVVYVYDQRPRLLNARLGANPPQPRDRPSDRTRDRRRDRTRDRRRRNRGGS